MQNRGLIAAYLFPRIMQAWRIACSLTDKVIVLMHMPFFWIIINRALKEPGKNWGIRLISPMHWPYGLKCIIRILEMIYNCRGYTFSTLNHTRADPRASTGTKWKLARRSHSASFRKLTTTRAGKLRVKVVGSSAANMAFRRAASSALPAPGSSTYMRHFQSNSLAKWHCSC